MHLFMYSFSNFQVFFSIALFFSSFVMSCPLSLQALIILFFIFSPLFLSTLVHAKRTQKNAIAMAGNVVGRGSAHPARPQQGADAGAERSPQGGIRRPRGRVRGEDPADLTSLRQPAQAAGGQRRHLNVTRCWSTGLGREAVWSANAVV